MGVQVKHWVRQYFNTELQTVRISLWLSNTAEVIEMVCLCLHWSILIPRLSTQGGRCWAI